MCVRLILTCVFLLSWLVSGCVDRRTAAHFLWWRRAPRSLRKNERPPLSVMSFPSSNKRYCVFVEALSALKRLAGQARSAGAGRRRLAGFTLETRRTRSAMPPLSTDRRKHNHKVTYSETFVWLVMKILGNMESPPTPPQDFRVEEMLLMS